MGSVYLLTCDKFLIQYVGQTGRKFSDRIKEHKNSVDNREKTLGQHFKLPGHDKAYIDRVPLDKTLS